MYLSFCDPHAEHSELLGSESVQGDDSDSDEDVFCLSPQHTQSLERMVTRPGVHNDKW